MQKICGIKPLEKRCERMTRGITRKEEGLLPDFASWSEATNYFRNRFPNSFLYIGNAETSCGKIWTYHLILDYPAYMKGMRGLRESGHVAGLELMDSYQTIEIHDDGRVHIIH